MAIYSTFFVCRPDELLAGFPDWKLPLATPVRREVRNPFTGEILVIESREPDWPEDVVGSAPAQQYKVVCIQGNYQDYLEARLPTFVRRCRHWATKGLTAVELDPLLEAAGISGKVQDAIYCPPSESACVQQFPSEFADRIASLNVEAVAEKWAATMSLPERTHSVTGVRISDGWNQKDTVNLLHAVMAISQSAAVGQRMYLLTEA
jgi:hypothetical protein